MNKLGPKSLSENKKLKKATLKSDNYKVVFHNKLSSVNVIEAEFKNYVSWSDVKIISQIKQIKQVENCSCRINMLPFSLPEDEESYYLIGNKRDIGKETRYLYVQKSIGFKQNLCDVVKFEFAKHDSHRVFVYIDEEKRVLNILFLDPYHHLAVSKGSRDKCDFPYCSCQNKNINIMSIVI